MFHVLTLHWTTTSTTKPMNDKIYVCERERATKRGKKTKIIISFSSYDLVLKILPLFLRVVCLFAFSLHAKFTLVYTFNENKRCSGKSFVYICILFGNFLLFLSWCASQACIDEKKKKSLHIKKGKTEHRMENISCEK